MKSLPRPGLALDSEGGYACLARLEDLQVSGFTHNDVESWNRVSTHFITATDVHASSALTPLSVERPASACVNDVCADFG